jgi:diguanylate cyclase (GGDEF)-like protein/PAS domain S-box-containing protein
MFRDISAAKTDGRVMSPLRLLFVLAITVFSVETLIMVTLGALPPMPEIASTMLDASLLVTLIFPVFYFLVFRPLTLNILELARLEAVRRADEASLRAMLDNSPYRAWLKDAEGRFLAVNEQFAQSCGKQSVADVVGKTDIEIMPGLLAEKYRADDQIVMAMRQQKYAEEKIIDHGKEKWFGTFKTPILDDHGKVIGTTGFSRDITERKWAEEQLRLTAKIFESSHDSIVITDTTGSIISANPAFAEITGYSAEEVIGKNPRILNSGRQGKEFYAEMWNSLQRIGYWNGEVWNRRKDGAGYAGRLSINALRDEAGKITHYIGVTSDITEYKAAQERIRNLAYFDQLTGLPNRSLLRDRVTQLMASAQRDKQEFSVLFIDLDNFKNVNDSLGHHAGDLLLQSVAERLRGSVREVDTVARLGGDEFVVVLPEVGVEGAQQVARKIIGQIANSYFIESHDLMVTTSMGISTFPKDALDMESLLKHADTALYRAKAKGKNDYAFFTEEMNTQAYERMTLENDLRRALLNDDLLLYYQPQIELSSGKVIGMEALLRWPHKEFGMIPPDQFIPIAEECGLIIELGEWVMHEACRQNRQWQLSGLPAIPVSVNVSSRQLRNVDLLDTVTSVLSHTRLDARYLELELTEHAVMDDVDAAIAVMKEIGGAGVGFAIDDFGTGYSSLAYLKRLPLDKVKIDQSFVHDLSVHGDDREIANAITQLAHSLRLTVVAEGVETKSQMDILLGQGCDSAQGYLFSRPLPPQEFAAFLRAAQTA